MLIQKTEPGLLPANFPNCSAGLSNRIKKGGVEILSWYHRGEEQNTVKRKKKKTIKEKLGASFLFTQGAGLDRGRKGGSLLGNG